MTSRSFSSVIQELHPELLVPIALFYLILRGLDTIEDDMTISLEEKDPLLRNFDTYTEKEGWSYDGNGPNEKDRELLVQWENVTEEFRKVKPAYREIIKDITNKMGNGMADFCANAEYNANGVDTVSDYDLYCHYVAGLVGNGLTRLFVESGLANQALMQRPQLQESMGLFLQKTNIIRDIREDFDDKRRFWPKEIWSKHVDKFEDLFDPKNQEAALNCSSEMVLNSLNHADQCLFYLAGLKEQSVFNFAAIPQSMAIATLELVFRNPNIFKKNVKITKGEACRIMMQSTQNLKLVCEVFRQFTRKIHKKNTPRDPNFLKISIACGKVSHPVAILSFVCRTNVLTSTPDRAIHRIHLPVARPQDHHRSTSSQRPTTTIPRRSQEQGDCEGGENGYLYFTYLSSPPQDTANSRSLPPGSRHGHALRHISDHGMLCSTIISPLCVESHTNPQEQFGTAYMFGARFDIAFQELRKGNPFKPSNAKDAASAIRDHDHGEL